MGNLALLLGVHSRAFHEWHGDGGIVGTKPYVSTGNYINRMSNFCGHDFKSATGDNACPFTTLCWDFLDRHYKQFKRNNRMAMQIKNVERKREQPEMDGIRKQADAIKRDWAP